MWYFFHQGRQLGPLDDEQLREYVKQGSLHASTPLREHGSTSFAPAGEVFPYFPWRSPPPVGAAAALRASSEGPSPPAPSSASSSARSASEPPSDAPASADLPAGGRWTSWVARLDRAIDRHDASTDYIPIFVVVGIFAALGKLMAIFPFVGSIGYAARAGSARDAGNREAARLAGRNARLLFLLTLFMLLGGWLLIGFFELVSFFLQLL